MDWSNRRWFNVSAPMWRLPIPGNERRTVRLWNAWRRLSNDGRWWGVGLLQIGRRHLLYVGRTQGYPEREVWDWSVLFLGPTR